MVIPPRIAAVGVLLAVAACSPTLDWRQVRSDESGVVAMFPCKPQRYARQVPLASMTVDLRLASCTAKETTYAIAYASVAQPGQVSAAVEELRRAAAANIGAPAVTGTAWSVRGMTPNPLAEKLLMDGHDAKGQAVREQAVFFVKGLRVYQATMVGPVLDAEAADTFFSGLKLTS